MLEPVPEPGQSHDSEAAIASEDESKYRESGPSLVKQDVEANDGDECDASL